MTKPLEIEPVHLGLLPLRLEASPSTSVDEHMWKDLDIDEFMNKSWVDTDKAIVEVLTELLRDKNISLSCQSSQRGDTILVRVSVIPSLTYKYGPTRSKRLRLLFQRLSKGWDEPKGDLLEAPNEDMNANMLALYALIQSPPEPQFHEAGPFMGDEEAHTALVNYENPLGVHTQMYKYQIRSVARMLQMETQPGTIVDPSYSPFTDPATGKPFYVDLTHMDIQPSPRRFPLSRGGILCEQMGVGKTLMCLALILVSKHQPTLPPPEAKDITGVLTEVSLREWSTESMAGLRQTIGMGDEHLVGTPSLASICADLVARANPSAGWMQDMNISPVAQQLLDDRQCVYYRFPPPVRFARAAKKYVPFRPLTKFILAPTTLIVVPLILVPQWAQEVETHLDEGALKLLVIPEGRRPLPRIGELVKYDAVLMSLERFRREGRREPDQLDIKTELLHARWKRIILDEGNIANNTKSEAMLLAEALSIERRWIVSGTPTTRLKQGTEVATRAFLQSEGMQRVSSSANSRSSTPVTVDSPSKRWSRQDLDDVNRLGGMLSSFLAADIFKVEDFKKLVTKPLRNKDGPVYGAVDRIRTIMSATMVKHRPGIVDEEVALPPSTMNAELLHFTPWQRLTYNALTALVASNVYTANFEDADYFLHPRNVEAFNQVVANLHLACLWFTGNEMDLEGALSRTIKHLETRPLLNADQKERLREAVAHMEAAIHTPGWTEWMRNSTASMPYDAAVLPISILDAWSDSPDSQPSLVDAHSLRRLRELNTRSAKINDIGRTGWDERAKRPQAEAFLKMMERAEKEWLKGNVARANGAIASTTQIHRNDTKAAADKPKAVRMVRKAGSTRGRPGLHNASGKDRNSAIDLAGEGDGGDDIDAQLNLAAQNAARAAEATSRPRPLPAVIRTASKSAKINWVIRTIFTAPAQDKFIIFGTFEEIAHMTEALDLSGISSVYAGAHVQAEGRKRALKDFADPGMRVCLLELKFAARGLTLTVANRMIFLSPVWSVDVQAQAIKRIHRIGQTRPTHIDILVTEGTFEEDIVARETSSRSNEAEKLYSRALIENPRFVQPHVSEEVEGDGAKYPIRLVPLAADLSEAEQIEHERLLRLVVPAGRTGRATGPGISVGAVRDQRIEVQEQHTVVDKQYSNTHKQQKGIHRQQPDGPKLHTDSNKRQYRQQTTPSSASPSLSPLPPLREQSPPAIGTKRAAGQPGEQVQEQSRKKAKIRVAFAEAGPSRAVPKVAFADAGPSRAAFADAGPSRVSFADGTGSSHNSGDLHSTHHAKTHAHPDEPTDIEPRKPAERARFAD